MARMASLTLSTSAQRAFERMAHDLGRIFGRRLTSVVATSPSASAAFVESIAVDDLEACAALTETWHRDGLATPVLLTADEINRSLDTFPLEYQALLDRHVVITGHPNLEAWRLSPDDVRRACEAQARGHLIHLRQGWLATGSHHHDRARLIVHSAPALRALLSSIAHLMGTSSDGTTDLSAVAGSMGLPTGLVRDILATETAPETAAALVARLPEYLAAAERLWVFIDEWRAR
jgi:hypothetical protein